MLIGLTGRNASGKGEVAEYLKKKSFYYYSLSDVIRDEIRSRGQQPTREVLIQVGNELRQQFGRAVLPSEFLRRSKTTSITSSIPSEIPSEVEAFRAAKTLQTDSRRCARRSAIRTHSGSEAAKAIRSTFESLWRLEKREARRRSTSQNLLQVEAMADTAVINDGSLEQALTRQVDQLHFQTVEANSAARLGSVLHGHREGCRFAIQLHEAEGCCDHRSRQARDLDRLQRNAARNAQLQ